MPVNNSLALSSAIIMALITGSVALRASGTYNGDGTQNRPIAHGLAAIPKFVYLFTTTGTLGFLQIPDRSTYCLATNAAQSHTVTQATTTDFYIGSPAANFYGNVAGSTYYWIAIS